MRTYASWQGLFVPYIKIVSNLYEGMDICPFECGHLPPLYKSAIRISVLFLYNTPPPPALCVKLREINTQLIVFFSYFETLWSEEGTLPVIISIGRKLTCKSQVIWASLDIIIRTPPPLENVRTLGSLEKYSFLCNQTIGPPPSINCKIN